MALVGHGSSISADSKLFYFQNIPVVGESEEVCTSYALFALERTTKLTGKHSASLKGDCMIKLIPLDWERLPTARHIASGLAEMPVFGVLETAEQEVEGEGGFTEAERDE